MADRETAGSAAAAAGDVASANGAGVASPAQAPVSGAGAGAGTGAGAGAGQGAGESAATGTAPTATDAGESGTSVAADGASGAKPGDDVAGDAEEGTQTLQVLDTRLTADCVEACPATFDGCSDVVVLGTYELNTETRVKSGQLTVFTVRRRADAALHACAVMFFTRVHVHMRWREARATCVCRLLTWRR